MYWKKLEVKYLNGVRYFAKSEIERFLREELSDKPTDAIVERTKKAIEGAKIKNSNSSE